MISDEYLSNFYFINSTTKETYKKNLTDIDWKDIQWTDMTDESFIIWMRTAGLPNFRKIWGRIDKKALVSGYYRLKITNLFESDQWKGTKTFAISTNNLMGGKNTFLAMCYLVTGVLCLLISIIFFMALVQKNKLNAKNK